MADLLRIFCGYDRREAVGWHVFAQSVLESAERFKRRVSLTPVGGDCRDGSTAFAYERFRCPELACFQGWAMFLDGADMLVRTNTDLGELLTLCDSRYAVRVVKHEYATRHPRKFVGTPLESANPDYPRKNWSSAVLWNCAHPLNRPLTPEFVADSSGAFLHRFHWLPDEVIGELPPEWNWLADEAGENQAAKVLHWTAGNPGFPAYAQAPHAFEWRAALARLNTQGVS